MRKLIYTILVLIVLIVAAFLVSPYFLGKSAEQQFNQQIALFNKESPYHHYVTLTTESYQRHWFSSDATVKLTFHVPPNLPSHATYNYTLHATIKHGPLYFVDGQTGDSMHFGAGAMVIHGNTPDFKGAIILNLASLDHLDIAANIPTLILDAPNDDVSVNFHNIQINTQSGQENNMIYTLNIPKIVVEGKKTPADGNAVINDTKLTLNGHVGRSLWLGSGDFSIDRITVNLIKDGITMPLSMTKNLTINFENNLTRDHTKLNSSFTFNIESLDAMGSTIKPITLSYSVDGIDAHAYQELKNIIDKMQAKGHLTNPGTGEIMQTVSALSKLISHGFTVKIDKIYAGLPKNLASSPLSANAQLTVKPVPELMEKLLGIAAASVEPNNDFDVNASAHQSVQDKLMGHLPEIAEDLVKAVLANGHASLPQNLVQEALLSHYTSLLMHRAAHGTAVTETPQDLSNKAYDYLVHHKMLIPNDKGAVTTGFTFKNGKLLINGEQPALALPQPSTPSNKIAVPQTSTATTSE